MNENFFIWLQKDISYKLNRYIFVGLEKAKYCLGKVYFEFIKYLNGIVLPYDEISLSMKSPLYFTTVYSLGI